MDTMTMTKAMGALCGSLLVFLLGGFVGEKIYHSSHGDDHHQAYSIDTGAEEEADPVPEVPFAEVFALADASAGERVFRKCAACHKLDGTDGTGPHLNGVVGRAVGSSDGFPYSGALQEVAEAWTPEVLNGFLENPKAYASGTSMNFVGLSKPEDRANLIAYLQASN